MIVYCNRMYQFPAGPEMQIKFIQFLSILKRRAAQTVCVMQYMSCAEKCQAHSGLKNISKNSLLHLIHHCPAGVSVCSLRKSRGIQHYYAAFRHFVRIAERRCSLDSCRMQVADLKPFRIDIFSHYYRGNLCIIT